MGACQEQPDCGLKIGGAGHFANYPQDLPFDEVSNRAEYFASVNVSRAQAGSLYDYGEKRFHLRAWKSGSEGEEELLNECLALFAGKYDIEFQWEQPGELIVVIDFENAQGIEGHLVNTFHLPLEEQ